MKAIHKKPAFFMVDCLVGIALLLILSNVLAKSWAIVFGMHRNIIQSTKKLNALVRVIEERNNVLNTNIHVTRVPVDLHTYGLAQLSKPFYLTKFSDADVALVIYKNP